MANAEHVKIVRQGAKAIAEWRASQWGGRLDVSGADLRGVDLSEADLRNADLRRASLNGADLSAADLVWAQLANADLSEADLSKADLFGAGLTGVDLSGADLSYTNLHAASLSDAKMHATRLDLTILGDIDLSSAEGLESVRHEGPSVIDEQTLRKSWPLPEVFLRGCGLSDQLIQYLPALFSQAIEFYSCFISYSSKDEQFAKRLHADLQDRGVRCWFAPEDLRIGDKFRVRIDEAIRLHDKLLLILSDHSVSSPWVEEEVESAMEKERKAKQRGEERTVLFPIRLDDSVMDSDTAWAASIRRTRHIGDFTRWKQHDEYQKSFERLLRDLKAGQAEPPLAT